MNNLPPDNQDVGNEPLETDLHEQAGLMCVGKDEDGVLEWQGTKAQWNKFEELEANQE